MSEYNSQTGTYNNNPVITLNKNVDGEDKRVMSFGVKKAKAILAEMEAIKSFVEANDKSPKVPDDSDSQKIPST